MSKKEFKPGNPGQRMIAFSKWVMFRPHEKKLIMKLFKVTLENYLKKAKKSHWIKLECIWKNMGCKPTYNREKDKYSSKK